MARAVQFAGVFLLVIGVSGAIDHLAGQPVLAPVLNVFNRYVIPHVGFLAGFETFANLTVAAFGMGMVILARRSDSAG
ncbi:hypothetical protein [Amycolatopsis sp. YIM 10]|uniref:hypothetical protein n=1 Tax=Amycolatopsis sp. YIM 10 TaxID=2653857 RepID=UPI00128FD3ED|nr:hypothetical protein [Amycolatopsis sp. YIM 10]QFU89726.1 hypothetical protein YIM_22745 [Amycolatopsis sp. YIM 10]